MRNPFKVIFYATKAVPFVKYAIGIAGIAAIIAIIKSFNVGYRVAFWGTCLMLCLMVILYLFASLTQNKDKNIKLMAVVLTWGVVIIFISSMLCLFSSVFFQYPLNLCKWLDPNCGNKVIVVPKSDSTLLKKDTSLKPKIETVKKPELVYIPPPRFINIQLKHNTGGFRKVYINKELTPVEIESTSYNPRVLVSYAKTYEILIITNNGDSCFSFIRHSDNGMRITPDCIHN